MPIFNFFLNLTLMSDSEGKNGGEKEKKSRKKLMGEISGGGGGVKK